MDWHRATLLCGLLISAAVSAPAQQPPESPVGAGNFTVTGDVERPGNFSFSQPLSLRTAIAAASPVSDAVNVTVLRNGHDRAQSTRLLRLSGVDSGERAMAGDLYVVESISALSRPVQPNAVLRSATGTTVISLEDTGVVVGDVLHGLGLPITPQTQVSIPCRIHGQRSLESAPLSAAVRHGDVISVTGAAVLTADGLPTMRPLVSEWKAGTSGPFISQPQNISPRPSLPQQTRFPELPTLTPSGAPSLPPEHTKDSATVTRTEESHASQPAAGFAASAPTTSAAPNSIPSPFAPLDSPAPRRPAPAPGRSDSRIVIVGNGSQPREKSAAHEEILPLIDGLRNPAPPVNSASPSSSPSAPLSGTQSRNISQNGRVPVSAAVATKTAPPTADADSASTPQNGQSRASRDWLPSLHWALILGLFFAGVWVLGRSLLTGSLMAATAQPAPANAAAGDARGLHVPAGSESRMQHAASPIPNVPANSVASAAADTPWRIYSVPRALRPDDTAASATESTDELNLLIANRLPIDRTQPQLPGSIELTGHPANAAAKMIRRIDDPHPVLRGRHGTPQEAAGRRGRSLEERLSQLIRTVPSGSPQGTAEPERPADSSGAVR